MDIPQEISEKIASYIRRPYKDEDIMVIVGRRLEICMPLELFIERSREPGTKESVIQRHAHWARKKWVMGERELYIY